MFVEFLDTINAVAANPPRFLQLDMLLRILLQVLLFCLSAFFSGSETALFSLSKFDLQRISRSKSPVSDTLHDLLDQPRRLIVSILCGNELVNIAAAANMTAILAELLGVETAAWAATIVMIPLILLIGEVTPKTLAVNNPVWTSTRIVATPLSVWMRVISPFAIVVRAVADHITTLLIGPERARENILYIEELRSLLEEGIKKGEITATERSLVQGLLSAGATEVREIMTPRPEVAFIDGEQDRALIHEKFLELRHPRVPVYVKNRDNIVGFLYVEDVLTAAKLPVPTGQSSASVLATLHPALAVPPTKEVDEMLDFFDENDARAALVVNEFGSIDGIVSIDDVTSFLFAGIYEELPSSTQEITAVDGAYEIEGSTPLSEIRHITGMDIPETKMTTIAGTAIRNFGSIPRVGDSIQIEGYTLEILAMENLRISRVRLEKTQPDKDVEKEVHP
ncbi:MAG: hemolysin family protein [Proteobacteria bacterium]|nr:hemolysin family protein [Pseudomonadota bacterium]